MSSRSQSSRSQSSRSHSSRSQPSRTQPSFGRRGRSGSGVGHRYREAGSVPAVPTDDRWSPRRALAFVVAASTGLWGVIALIVYGSLLLLRR